MVVYLKVKCIGLIVIRLNKRSNEVSKLVLIFKLNCILIDEIDYNLINLELIFLFYLYFLINVWNILDIFLMIDIIVEFS